MLIILFIFLLITIIFASHVFNLVGWYNTFIPLFLDIIGVFYFLFYFFKGRLNIKGKSEIFGLINFLWFWPLVTLFVKQILTPEPIQFEMQSLIMMSFAFLSYYFLIYYRVSETFLINIVITIVILTFFIQIWQQYFSPIPIFGVNDRDLGAIRNGLHRYIIPTISFVSFCLFYCFDRLNRKFSKQYLILFVICLISIYLSLTRQLIISTLITIICGFFIMKSRNKYRKMFVGICIFLIIIFNYYDTLFRNLIEMTLNDTYSTEIRANALPFIFSRSTDNILQFVVGHAHPQQILKWGETKGYWTVDLGLFGELYSYGIMWLFIYLMMIYKIIFKFKNNIPLYIRLFVIDSFIHSFMVAPYVSPLNCYLWTFMLYICNMYIKEPSSFKV